MPSNRFQWPTAVHEAGHAIVAWALGLSVGGLELFDADGAGRSWIEDNTHLEVVDQIAVCAAGIEAVELLDAGAFLDGAALSQAGYSDHGKIIELLADRPEAEHDGIRHEGHRRARTMLEQNQDRLRAVAEALASAGHLDAEGFRKICVRLAGPAEPRAVP